MPGNGRLFVRGVIRMNDIIEKLEREKINTYIQKRKSMSIIEKLGITANNDIFLANDNRNYSKIITDNYEYIVDSTAPISLEDQKIIHNEIRVMGAASELLVVLTDIIKIQNNPSESLSNLNGSIRNAENMLIDKFPDIKELLS